MRQIKTWVCENCGKTFEKVNTGHTYRFCKRSCAALYNKPSQALVIADDQPMSKRTLARRKKAAGLVKPQEKTIVNQDLFSTWSSELAWLVGLIWSDGNLSKNTIEICSKDFQLIDLVLSLTDGRYGLKNNGQHLRIFFASKEVAAFLRSVGLTERKSLTIGWPMMPAIYHGDFMRGLIDGDGSILFKKDRPGQQASDLFVQLVTASPALRDGIAQWFSDQGIVYGLYKREYKDSTWNPLWRFTIVKHASLSNLYPLLYPKEDVVCLHRKHIPYIEWLETPRAQAGRPKG